MYKVKIKYLNFNILIQQAEKLKSREMKEGWMKNDEWWRMNDEDDDFKLLKGFADERTDKQTFVIVESISRLKTEEEEWGIFKKTFNMCHQFSCVHHKPYSRARHISLKGIENLIRKDYLLNILYTIIVS